MGVVEVVVGVVFVGAVVGVMGYAVYKNNKSVRDKIDELKNRLDD